jgi:hypothetical protein
MATFCQERCGDMKEPVILDSCTRWVQRTSYNHCSRCQVLCIDVRYSPASMGRPV